VSSPELRADAVEAGIREILRETASVEVPSADFDLLESGVLDSLTFVDLVFQIEQRFGVTLDIETLDLESLRTVASLGAAVRAAAEPADGERLGGTADRG